MAELIERFGPVDLTPAEHEYQRLVVSIINQQVSTASALAIKERVFELFDGPLTPDAVLDADERSLRDAGLSGQKVEYVRNCAEAFTRDDLTHDGLADASADEVIERLTSIRGVGEWTANMYLMFVLGREDVLPLGDLAVRKGIDERYGSGDGSMSREEMRAVAEQWRPYRSYGTKYVWLDYEAE